MSIDASIYVEVEASSPEEAEEKAMMKAVSPRLCHQCAGELDVADVLEVLEVINIDA